MPSVSPSLYSYTVSAQQAILSVGYTLLGIFFLIELWNISKKVESFGGGPQLGVEMIVGLLIKLTLCKLLMDNSMLIMEALYDGLTQVTAKIAGLWTDSGSAAALDTEIVLSYLPASMFELIPPFLLGLLTLLIVAVAALISRILIWLRFIEIFLRIILSPIPLATLPSDEWGQVGKNFLKGFVAVCIQGTLIFLVLSFFPALIGAYGQSAIDVDGPLALYSYFLQCCGMSILLIIALFATTRLANSICSAM